VKSKLSSFHVQHPDTELASKLLDVIDVCEAVTANILRVILIMFKFFISLSLVVYYIYIILTILMVIC